MLTKICGLSNVIDALYATECGSSALGFVMGGKVLPVEVEPHAQTVREIIRLVNGRADTYLVTHLMAPKDIVDLAEYIGCSGIQISEDVGVSVAMAVRESTSKKIIKTVVAAGQASLEKLQSYEPYCDYILLDSQVAGYVGGTGATSDWTLCSELVAASSRPVFLAGGLTPQNVEEAIRATKPHGVDVSTGVSTYSPDYLRKDRKDPEKIKTFISKARSLVAHAVS
jgi:phosphoribosylanthranilate isomerase